MGGLHEPRRSYTKGRSEARSTLGIQTPSGNEISPHKAGNSTCEFRSGVTVAPEVWCRSTAACGDYTVNAWRTKYGRQASSEEG